MVTVQENTNMPLSHQLAAHVVTGFFAFPFVLALAILAASAFRGEAGQ